MHTPSGRTMRPTLLDNGDGTVTAQFQPTEPGLHELEITYNGQPIPGSPFRFYVEAVGSGNVSAYGPGLSYGRSGEPADFTLVTKEAGAGKFSKVFQCMIMISRSYLSDFPICRIKRNRLCFCTISFSHFFLADIIYRSAIWPEGFPYVTEFRLDVQIPPIRSIESGSYSPGTSVFRRSLVHTL